MREGGREGGREGEGGEEGGDRCSAVKGGMLDRSVKFNLHS